MSSHPRRKLFGTDGIRGNADTDLVPELMRDIGRAVAHAAANGVIGRSEPPRFVIGRDTRVSGPKLQDAFIEGATGAGADVAVGGLLPTAAVAYLTSLLNFDAGVVISASHNPSHDNGVKLFGPGGWKLSVEQETAIESMVADGVPDAIEPGRSSDLADASVAYVTHLCAMASRPLRGMRVVADCANGAASAIVPQTFDRLGLEAVILNANLDGSRINDRCGAMHPEVVAAAASEERAIGLTFDGDADRVLLADENGRVIDGDAILAILGKGLRDQGVLSSDTLVATVMANQALRRWCHEQDVVLHEVAVGDRYVLEGMREKNAVLGGEQSGHIIRLDRATTGDGILVAIAVLDAVAASGGTLADLVPFDPMPQVIVNVRAARRDEAERSDAIRAACEAAEARLGDDGRVLVRPSGTEPLVRVMVEAAERDVAARIAADIADVVRAEIGDAD
jgi:phosphoglucosamine mutase